MRLIDADALMTELMDSDLDHLQRDDWKEVIQIVTDAPTITPEPHWIPVTEPPKGDFMPYYATCRSKVDDRENWVIEGMYTKYSGWECPPMVRDDRAEIIAWMPKELPEPFKGVTE